MTDFQTTVLIEDCLVRSALYVWGKTESRGRNLDIVDEDNRLDRNWWSRARDGVKWCFNKTVNYSNNTIILSEQAMLWISSSNVYVLLYL